LIDFGRMFYGLNPERQDAILGETDNPIEYRIQARDGRFPPVSIVDHVDRSVTHVDVGGPTLIKLDPHLREASDQFAIGKNVGSRQ
jgi:hypothetical protein